MKLPFPRRAAARCVLLPMALGTARAAVAAGPADVTEAAAAAPAAWQLLLRTDRHSDVLTIAEVKDEAYERARPRGEHNLVYLEDEARLQRRAGDWHIGLVARASATLVLNRDAVEVAAQAAGAPATGSRQWQVSARLRGFSGAGVEVGQGLAVASDWRLAWSAQALALTRLQDRRVTGPASYDAAAQAYAFDLRSSESNNHRRFPFQQDFAARGAALLLGAELAWQRDGHGVALSVRDAGWLRWSGLPHQEAQLATGVKDRDADGFLLYGPLIQGRNSQPTYSERWPARWALRGHWQAQPALGLSASLQTVPGFGVLPAVGLQQRLGRDGQTQLSLGWRFHERRASAGLDWKGWRLEAGADRLGSAAHSRLLALSYTMPL